MKKHMNKRNLVLALALVLVLSFGLSACDLFGSKPETNMEKASESSLNESSAEESSKGEAPAAESSKEDKVEEAKSENKDEDFVGTLESSPSEDTEDAEAPPILHAVDFSLRDQNGDRHNLEDYKGKVIILNFWQTWCPPCRAEMPDFQKVYEKYNENKDDVVILGVASPKNELNTSYTQEQETDEGIAKFLADNNYSYPNLMDYTAELYFQYQVQSFPTTIVVDKEGNLYGYQPGMVREEQLVKVIEDVLAK